MVLTLAGAHQLGRALVGLRVLEPRVLCKPHAGHLGQGLQGQHGGGGDVGRGDDRLLEGRCAHGMLPRLPLSDVERR
eukprot:2086070-Rhodomonas_salina.1